MSLEYTILTFTALAETTILLLLTLPGLARLRPSLVSLTRNSLKPMISVVPFCLFLLLDAYWKHEPFPVCGDEHVCPLAEILRHEKSVMKSQRNGALIGVTLLLNWLVLAVTRIVVHVEQLEERIERLRRGD